MKSYYNLLLFRLLTWNRHMLLLSLPALGILISVYIVLTRTEQFYSTQLNWEKTLILVLILAITSVCWIYFKGIMPLNTDFKSLKYSNLHVSMFKLLSDQDKKLFHKYIIDSIAKRDLNLSKLTSSFESSPKCHRILLKELNSTSFKQKLLSELSFERFQIELSDGLKKSGWARDFLNYQGPIERALFITAKYASDSAILNSMDGIKETIISNINIGSEGVRLDSKGLKEGITNVNKNVTEINLKYRIILNPSITQKQFAQILDVYSKNNQNGFKAARFTAYFTGFEHYSECRYNLPNIFKPYSMDLGELGLKEFIKLISYLVYRRVIPEASNSSSKLARILELFLENYLKGHQILRKEISKEISENSLHPKLRRDIGTAIDTYLPIPKNNFPN